MDGESKRKMEMEVEVSPPKYRNCIFWKTVTRVNF